MTCNYLKDSASVLDYGLDWSTWLGADTLLTSVWTVPAGITKDSDSKTDTTTTIWLSGGTTGVAYLATNKITTAGSRTAERSIRIKIEDR